MAFENAKFKRDESSDSEDIAEVPNPEKNLVLISPVRLQKVSGKQIQSSILIEDFSSSPSGKNGKPSSDNGICNGRAPCQERSSFFELG